MGRWPQMTHWLHPLSSLLSYICGGGRRPTSSGAGGGRVRKNPARRVKSDSESSSIQFMFVSPPPPPPPDAAATYTRSTQRECRMTLHFSFFTTDLTLCARCESNYSHQQPGTGSILFTFCPFSPRERLTTGQRDENVSHTNNFCYGPATSFAVSCGLHALPASCKMSCWSWTRAHAETAGAVLFSTPRNQFGPARVRRVQPLAGSPSARLLLYCESPPSLFATTDRSSNSPRVRAIF